MADCRFSKEGIPAERRIEGALPRRLLCCEQASPTIEFALVAPAFIALLLGILHVALVYLAQDELP